MTPHDRDAERMQRERTSIWDGSTQDKREQLRQEEVFCSRAETKQEAMMPTKTVKCVDIATWKGAFDQDILRTDPEHDFYVYSGYRTPEQLRELRQAIDEALERVVEPQEMESETP